MKRLLPLLVVIVGIILMPTAHAARLPVVGGDNNDWGTILNDFLNVSHDAGGHLRLTGSINVSTNNTFLFGNATNMMAQIFSGQFFEGGTALSSKYCLSDGSNCAIGGSAGIVSWLYDGVFLSPNVTTAVVNLSSPITGTDLDIRWNNLTNYPSACNSSSTITALGDSITCTSISITEDAVSNLDHPVPLLYDGEVYTTNVTNGNVTVSGRFNATGNVIFPGLVSCDTINTTANGTLICGVDDMGSSSIISWLYDGSVFRTNVTSAVEVIGQLNATGRVNFTNTLFTDGSGNVGIGTAAPGAVLDVEGDLKINSNWLLQSEEQGGIDRLTIKAVGASSAAELFLHPTGATDTSRITISDNVNTVNYDGIAIEATSTENTIESVKEGTGTAQPLKIKMDGTDVITVQQDNDVVFENGNVGINTTSPAEFLHISGSASPSLRIETVISSDTMLQLVHPSQSWSVGIDNTGGGLFKIANNLDPGTNDRLTIDTSGNVGINTTTPGALLHVSSGDILLDNKQFLQWKDSGGTVRNIIQVDGGDNMNIGSSSLDDIKFIVGTVGTSMTIQDATGNVGINTSSPAAKLHVYGNGADVELRISEDSGTKESRLNLRQGSNDWEVMANSVGHFAIEHEGIERLRIDGSGKVGINTTTPSHKLQINSPDEDTLRLVGPGATNGEGACLEFGDDADNPSNAGICERTDDNLTIETSAVERVRITDDGRVGIAESQPEAAVSIDVSGFVSAAQRVLLKDTANSIGDWRPYSGSTTISLQLVSPDNTGLTIAPTISSQGQSEIISSARLDFYTDNEVATSGKTHVLTLNGSLVGIGTKSPENELHIETASASLPILRMTSTGSGNDVTMGRSSGLFVGGTATGLGIRGSTHVWLGVGATATIYMDASNRLGIGTSNPQNTLNVVGDINATGSVLGGNSSFHYGNFTGHFRGVENSNLIFPSDKSGIEFYYDGAADLGAVISFNRTEATYERLLHLGKTHEFWCNGTVNCVYIDADGNFGIGAGSTPQNTLNVVGDINTTQDLILTNSTIQNALRINFNESNVSIVAKSGDANWLSLIGADEPYQQEDLPRGNLHLYNLLARNLVELSGQAKIILGYTDTDKYIRYNSGTDRIELQTDNVTFHVRDTDLLVDNNVTIGSSGAPTNITMFSPDGTQFNCGVTNGGTYQCT